MSGFLRDRIIASEPIGKLRKRGILEVSDYSAFTELDINVRDSAEQTDTARSVPNVRFIETTIPVTETQALILTLGAEIADMDAPARLRGTLAQSDEAAVVEGNRFTIGTITEEQPVILAERFALITRHATDEATASASPRASATIRFGPDNVELDEVFEYDDGTLAQGTTNRTDFPDANDEARIYATLRHADAASLNDARVLLIGVIDHGQFIEQVTRHEGATTRTDTTSITAPDGALLTARVQDESTQSDPTHRQAGTSQRTDTAQDPVEILALRTQHTPEQSTPSEQQRANAIITHPNEAFSAQEALLKATLRQQSEQASVQSASIAQTGAHHPPTEIGDLADINPRLSVRHIADEPAASAQIRHAALARLADGAPPASEAILAALTARLSGDAPPASDAARANGTGRISDAGSAQEHAAWMQLRLWANIALGGSSVGINDAWAGPPGFVGDVVQDDLAAEGFSFGHPVGRPLPSPDYLAGMVIKKARIGWAINVNALPDATVAHKLGYHLRPQNYLVRDLDPASSVPDPLYPVGYEFSSAGTNNWTSQTSFSAGGGNPIDGKLARHTIRVNTTPQAINYDRTTRTQKPFTTPSSFDLIQLRYWAKRLITNTAITINATMFIRVMRQSDDVVMFERRLNQNNDDTWTEFTEDLTSLLAASTQYYVALRITKGVGTDVIDLHLDEIRLEITPTSGAHARERTTVISYTNANTAYLSSTLRDLAATVEPTVPASVSVQRNRRPYGDPAIKHDGSSASQLDAGTNAIAGIGNSFSLRAWFRIDGAPSTSDGNGVLNYLFSVSGSGAGSTKRKFAIGTSTIDSTKMAVSLNVDDADGQVITADSRCPNVSDGSWHHVEFNHSGGSDDGTGRLFVDGIEVWSGTVKYVRTAGAYRAVVGGYFRDIDDTFVGRFNGAWCWMEYASVQRHTTSSSFTPPFQLVKDANSKILLDGEYQREVSPPGGAFGSSMVEHWSTLPDADLALGHMGLMKRLHLHALVDGTTVSSNLSVWGLCLELTLAPA